MEVRAIRSVRRKLKVLSKGTVKRKARPGLNVTRWLNGETPERDLSESKTMQAAVAAAVSTATGGATAVGYLNNTTQIIVIAAVVVALIGCSVIARERIKKRSKGDR